MIYKKLSFDELSLHLESEHKIWLRPFGVLNFNNFFNNKTTFLKQINFDIIWKKNQKYFFSRNNFEQTLKLSNKIGGILKKRLDSFLLQKKKIFLFFQ